MYSKDGVKVHKQCYTVCESIAMGYTCKGIAHHRACTVLQFAWCGMCVLRVTWVSFPSQNYLRVQPDNINNVNLVAEVAYFLQHFYSDINKDNIELVNRIIQTLVEMCVVSGTAATRQGVCACIHICVCVRACVQYCNAASFLLIGQLLQPGCHLWPSDCGHHQQHPPGQHLPWMQDCRRNSLHVTFVLP